MKSLRCHILGLLLLALLPSWAQDFSVSYLNKLDDESLLELFNDFANDSLNQEKIARTYLKRARMEGDTIKMARGYDRLARIFHPQKNIQFADSIIELTNKKSHKTYPALGYILKGQLYLQLDDLINSTENFLIAYNISKKNNNIPLQTFALNALIEFKSNWGNKFEALELQRKRHKIVSNEKYFDEIIATTRYGANVDFNDLYTKEVLSSYQIFTMCFINLKALDSANIYINKGLELVKTYNGEAIISPDYFRDWFLEAKLEVDFYNSEFDRVVANSEYLLTKMKLSKNSYSLMNLYLISGLTYMKLTNYDEGVKYLLDADSIADAIDILIKPNQRILYEQLLSYYSKSNNIDKKLIYLNKLLYIDSIFKINYRYFEPNLIRHYETPQMLEEKEVLIAGLTKKNKSTNTRFWITSLLLLGCLTYLIHVVRQQLLYKNRFEQLISQKGASADEVKKSVGRTFEISADLMDDILKHLDRFESENRFLSQEISLQELAKAFHTNTRYLSNIINLEKNKNFSQYINDLRVAFAFKELNENKLFRKYTILAIANDCGFKSSESFSRAFFRTYKIYPSFYIKKLDNLT